MSMDEDLVVAQFFVLVLLIIMAAMIVNFFDIEMFFLYHQAVLPSTSAGTVANEAALRKARQLEMARLSTEVEDDHGSSAAFKKRVAHAGASSGEVSPVFGSK